jgi:SAM-dependent methyltransferase
VKRLRLAVGSLRPYRPYQVPSEEHYESEASPHNPWALTKTAQLSAIAGYLRDTIGAGHVLDLGCGQGVLFHHLSPHFRYTGIDISPEAISRAQSREGRSEDASFHVADSATYEPGDPFHAFVFNESLYYLADPVGTVKRYERQLSKGGVYVISMYRAQASRSVWKALNGHRTANDTVRVQHRSGTTWDISLYRP